MKHATRTSVLSRRDLQRDLLFIVIAATTISALIYGARYLESFAGFSAPPAARIPAPVSAPHSQSRREVADGGGPSVQDDLPLSVDDAQKSADLALGAAQEAAEQAAAIARELPSPIR